MLFTMYFRSLYQFLEFLNRKRKLKTEEQCWASTGPRPWPAGPAAQNALADPSRSAQRTRGHGLVTTPRARAMARPPAATRPARRRGGGYDIGEPWG
jgi:hypothetical protein